MIISRQEGGERGRRASIPPYPKGYFTVWSYDQLSCVLLIFQHSDAYSTVQYPKRCRCVKHFLGSALCTSTYSIFLLLVLQWSATVLHVCLGAVALAHPHKFPLSLARSTSSVVGRLEAWVVTTACFPKLSLTTSVCDSLDAIVSITFWREMASSSCGAS